MEKPVDGLQAIQEDPLRRRRREMEKSRREREREREREGDYDCWVGGKVRYRIAHDANAIGRE